MELCSTNILYYIVRSNLLVREIRRDAMGEMTLYFRP